MSSPYVNPYEQKDVVATSLNNLDKQSNDLVAYLDGFFSSETTTDREIVFDDGSVETLKPVKVSNNPGAFWDKGTTYYFQPIGERLKEITNELQGKLDDGKIASSLQKHIESLFAASLDASGYKLHGEGTGLADYETLVDTTTDSIYKPAVTDLDAFFKAIKTSNFNLMLASGNATDSILAFTNTQFGKVDLDVKELAKLLDDGDNSFNDNPTIDDPDTLGVNEAIDDKSPSQQFYLVGNNQVPVFGKFNPVSGATGLDKYNQDNKRIDFNSPDWKSGTTYDTSEKVLFGMLAIALTGQSFDKNNQKTMENAEETLKKQAKEYFQNSLAWYNAAPPRDTVTNVPSFPLADVDATGTITYTTTDPLYGGFKPDDTGNLFTLIAQATGSTYSAIPTSPDYFFKLWDGSHDAELNKVMKYYTQSYINYSITSSFNTDDPKFATKNLFLHNVITSKTNLNSDYNKYWVEDPGSGKTILNFSKVFQDLVPADYLRKSADHSVMSDQMAQLADLFLENFDISAGRYVKDNRTLVDLFSGKLNADPNSNVDNILFQNINAAASDMVTQTKNILSRGIPEALSSQFAFDIFNQTSVRKEDYGLSPVPGGAAGDDFLPDYWTNTKEKFLPALYYYDPAGYTPSGSTDPYASKFGTNKGYEPLTSDSLYTDKKNNSFNPADNGLPAGFPVMDIRDFGVFFEALKNELGQLLDKPPITGSDPITGDPSYPTWANTGLTVTATSVFGSVRLPLPADIGTLSEQDRQTYSKLSQFYDSVTSTLSHMTERLNVMKGQVPKIPRPESSTYVDSSGASYTLTLDSSASGSGYGDKPTAKLVTEFLKNHRDTKDYFISASPQFGDAISFLINTFDDASKFSQNDAFEAIYAGEAFEAGKMNKDILYGKKPEPLQDGSMPEEKDVPKPLMSALSSSVVVTKVGQLLSAKVNAIIQNNQINSITDIKRDAAGNIITSNMTGSQVGQTYLKNILSQISEVANTGHIKMDLSTVAAQVSKKTEEGVNQLLAATNSNDYRMTYIDNLVLDKLLELRNTLDQFNPYPANQFEPAYTNSDNEDLIAIKQILDQADLDALKTKAFANDPKGYLHYLDLTLGQRDLMEKIRDGDYRVDSSGAVPVLQVKKSGIYKSVIPDDTRPVEVKFDLLTNLQSESDADIDFNVLINMTNADADGSGSMSYNAIVESPSKASDFKQPPSSAAKEARKILLDKLLGKTVPALSFTANLNKSSADSFTLKEVYDEENTLQADLLAGIAADTTENRQLFIRRMQHYSVLFNTLASDNSNLTVGSFRDAVVNKAKKDFNLIDKLDHSGKQTIVEYLGSIATDDTQPDSISKSQEFQNVAKAVERLTPIVDNMKALDVTLAADLKKTKNGPEADLDSTLYLFNEIENQIQEPSSHVAPLSPPDYVSGAMQNLNEDFLGGVLQIFNRRKIKENPPISALQTVKGFIRASQAAALLTKAELDATPVNWSEAEKKADAAFQQITDTIIKIDAAITYVEGKGLDSLNLKVLKGKAEQVKIHIENAKTETHAHNVTGAQAANSLATTHVGEVITVARGLVDVDDQVPTLKILEQNPGHPSSLQDLKDGNYNYKGYAANIQYLDPATTPTLSGAAGTTKPATTRWDIKTMIQNYGGTLPPATGFADPDDVNNLNDMREFLVAALNVYKDMEQSNAPDIKQQLKEYDLWLQNNALSKIGHDSLNGKEGLKADIAFIDHIIKGTTVVSGAAPTEASLNQFFLDSKDAALFNKQKITTSNEARLAAKGLAQKITGGAASAEDLQKYYLGYTETLTPAPPPPAPATVFHPGVASPHYPLDGSTSATPLVGLLGTAYMQIYQNITTILSKLKEAEDAEKNNGIDCTKEKQMYKAMLLNLLGESSAGVTAEFIAQVQNEAAQISSNRTNNVLYPPPAALPTLPSTPPSLEGNGLTYTNNVPSMGVASKITQLRKEMDNIVDPERFKGTVDAAALKNFTLTAVANTPGVAGKSVQELAILLYVLQMFESSNWDYEKYVNDTSRYEITAAVE